MSVAATKIHVVVFLLTACGLRGRELAHHWDFDTDESDTFGDLYDQSYAFVPGDTANRENYGTLGSIDLSRGRQFCTDSEALDCANVPFSKGVYISQVD